MYGKKNPRDKQPFTLTFTPLISCWRKPEYLKKTQVTLKFFLWNSERKLPSFKHHYNLHNSFTKDTHPPSAPSKRNKQMAVWLSVVPAGLLEEPWSLQQRTNQLMWSTWTCQVQLNHTPATNSHTLSHTREKKEKNIRGVLAPFPSK